MVFQNELLTSLRENGNRTAIEYKGNNYTYHDLLTSSEKVAAFLLKEGLQKETVVALQLKDKKELICAIIGVLRAGCVFVLIDSSWPHERIASIVEAIDLKYIISSGDATIPGGSQVSKYLIEEVLDRQEAAATGIPYPVYDEEDSVYIYFTSGSTGVPKGIVGKNCSLLQFLQWEIATFDIGNTTRVSQFISPYFDAFLRDVFAPLLAGGTLCIPPEEEDFFTPGKIIPWIDKQQVNVIHCVPSLFRVMNDRYLLPENFSALKYVLLSGEKINPRELWNWYNIFGSRIQLVNFYGLTETTMIRSFYKIVPDDVYADKIPIGAPIWDTELLVAKEDLTPAGLLMPGDLYIITAYTAKGYLNAPELTQSRFLKLNADPADKRIAFKTGDKARTLADGRIVLIGREDRQVKLRGIRIELDEIENILMRSAFIRNAVVVVHTEEQVTSGLLLKTPSGLLENVLRENESLVAFVIRIPGLEKDFDLQEEAYTYLKSLVPAYMIPRIVEVNEYPLLSSGKVNNKELLKLLEVTETIAPEDETEARILAIWKQILGDKPISTTDSFHRIGGDSLGMMSLVGKIQGEFNVRISLHELFNNMTIKQQAEIIRRSNTDRLFVISRSAKKPVYDVSSTQERIYYNYEVNRNSTAYNISMAFEMKGTFDMDKLRYAFRGLIERHESLRTAFLFSGGRLVQTIQDEVDFELEEINAPGQDIQSAIAAFIRPFELAQAPLIRGCLISTSEGRRILVVDIHHIVCDGRSQLNLYSDFQKLYKGEQLPPLNLQYKDYAEWERRLRATKEYNAFREFWLSKFDKEIPKLNFPLVHAGAPVLSDDGRAEIFDINLSAMDAVVKLLGEEEVTTFSAVFATFFVYLAQLTGQTDMVVGVISSGRSQYELEDVVGMFVKTLPIRYQIDVNMLFKDFVREMHRNLVQANSNQFYDLADILDELSAKRKPGAATGLFDVLFDFQNFKGAIVDTDDVTFSSFDFDKNTTKYPMTVICIQGAERIYFRLEYMTQYFTSSDIQLVISQFRNLVQSVSEDPGSRILDLLDVNSTGKMIEDNITFNFS